MQFFKSKYKLWVISFSVTLFFYCDISSESPLTNTNTKKQPLSTAYNIRLVYTDSTKVKAILEAPSYIDYSNLFLQKSEFPQGLKITFLDDLKNKNIVLADYGILYNQTSIIDLSGNVSLSSGNGSILKTEQLYWDASNDWIFTEKQFSFVGGEYDIVATRLDTNKEFTKFQTGKLTGTVKVLQNE